MTFPKTLMKGSNLIIPRPIRNVSEGKNEGRETPRIGSARGIPVTQRSLTYDATDGFDLRQIRRPTNLPTPMMGVFG